MKPREIAENNRLLKKKKESEENKIKEKDMWQRLNKINGEFKNIKTAKKGGQKHVFNSNKLGLIIFFVLNYVIFLLKRDKFINKNV